MLSAAYGEYNPNQVGGYGGAQAPNASMPVPSYQPTFQRTPNQGPTFPSLTTKVELEKGEGKQLLDSQMTWAGWTTVGNMAGQTLDGIWQFLLGKDQLSVMNKYYDTQGHIADKQAEVLVKQEDTKIAAIHTQREMLANNNKTQKELKRLDTQRDVAIASISEKGRNERAKIYSSSKAFSIGPANQYGYGNPVRSFLT